MTPNCLNCATVNQYNYCPNCGQKASTHRYSIQHFIEHDFIHGVWHVDRGVLFTLKELFTRPGHSIRGFIQGKRANHFSFVTLILMLLTISALMAPHAHMKMTDIMPKESQQMMNSLETFMSKYPKLVLLITIPFYSLFSLLWFRKAKLNFSEHLVLNSYRVIPEMIFNLLITSISIYYYNPKTLLLLISLVGIFGFIYSTWVYYQFFSGYGYTKKSAFLRSVMVPVSYILLSFFIGVILGMVKYITHQ